ncbi:protein kinase domain-containing protein [Candidatus Uabimicrobium amorphum]|uniref:non-specific serine/threonine protein kinase n=1 Tax=Uabimicrobium amorphum TaxID=2596890 RepID=A0A5S9IHI6_UABAM|nr:serine/threonine-protein kinase [Candidatus Uabimicrobium amorphum]BBM81883.1 protein kinase [Candidatus Uabimicrobium amorphum]
MTNENAKGMGVTGGRSSSIQYGSEMVGYQLGGCEIVEFIGKGGMGAVYKAIQTNLNREVALKILSTPNKDGKAIEWFQREAQSIAQLEHKNIIQVYALDYSEELETFYIVMQYVDGASLDKLVKSLDGGRLPIEKALEYAIQVAEGLYSAHEKNIIHRDVKPANIMVTMDEVIKITDFGLAKSLSIHTTSSASAGLIVGTPLYMAPEQCVGTQIDARTDIYSLGASLYYLLVGRPPFMGDNSYDILEKQITEAPKPISQIDPEIPEELSNIVLKMLAKNREDRYQSCAEVAEELRQLINPQTTANVEGVGEEKTIYRLSGVSQQQLADGLDKIINEGRKGILSIRSKEEHLFLYIENNTIYAYLENYMEEFTQKHSQLSFTEMITLLITISFSWDPFTWEFVEEEPPGEFRDYCIAARVDIFSFLRNTSTAIQIFLSLVQPGSLIIRTPIKSILISYTPESIYACSPLPHRDNAQFLLPEQAEATIENILQSNYSLEYQTILDITPEEQEENSLAGIFFQILEGCPDYSFFQGFSIFDKSIFPSSENKITITKVRELETKLGRVLQQMFEGYKKLEEIGLPKYYAILFAGAIVKDKALLAANKIGEIVRTVFDEKDTSIAKPLIDISLKLYRYNFKLMEEIAEGYEAAKDTSKAIEYWLRCGKLREELQDFERADSCYKYATTLDNKSYEPLQNLLNLYISYGRPTDDIIKTGEKLISKLRSAKETKLLVETCQRLIEIDPELLACHQELINYYIDEGRNEDAIESFEKIASIYKRQENRDALVQTYHKILKMDPNKDDVRERLFELEGKPVKLIRALDSATKVIKKNSFVVNPKYTFLGILGLFLAWFGYREISGYLEFQRLQQQVKVGNFLVVQQELEYIGKNFYFSGIHAEAMTLYVAEDKKIKNQLIERNKKALVKKLDYVVIQYKDNQAQLLKELDKIHAQYFQPEKEYLEKIVQKRIDDIRFEYAQKKKQKNEEDFANVQTLIEEKEFDKAEVILKNLRAQNYDLWNKRVEETMVLLEKEREKWVSEKIVREEQQQELLNEAREYESKGAIELAIETYSRAEALLKSSINAQRAKTYRESLTRDLADTKEWLEAATQELESGQEDDAYIYLERIVSNSKLINSRFLREAMWPTVITTSPMTNIPCYDGGKFLGKSPVVYKQKFAENVELRWQVKSVGLRLKKVDRVKINGQKTWKIVLHLERQPVWKFNTQGRIESPILVHKNKIICASRDNRIYCVNKSGEQIWKLYTGRLSEISGPMQIYKDHLFVATLAGYVYVLDLRKNVVDAKDTVVWSGRVSGASFRGGPRALGLNRMAVAARNGKFLVVNQSGSRFSVSKRYSLRDALEFTPVYNNGIAAVAGKKKVYFVDLRNNKVRSTRPYRISGEVSLGNNNLYIPTTRGVVVTDFSGKPLQRYPSQSSVVSQPVVDKDDVYFASSNGEIFKVKANAKKYLWKQKVSSKIRVPLLQYKNVIFVCGEYSVWAISKATGKIIMEYEATKEDEIYSKPTCDGEFLYFSSGKSVMKLWVKDIVE